MNFNAKISAIILAAGMSTRMGKANKLLHPYKTKPLISHIIKNASNSKIENITVVIGHQNEKIKPLIPKTCQTIFNHEYTEGLSSSIRAGVYGLHGLSAIMILPADMPLITTTAINKIIEIFLSHKDNKKIIVATNESKQGHPVLFGAAYFGKLKLLRGDKGARQIINENQQHLILENIGAAATTDFDTPNSFQN